MKRSAENLGNNDNSGNNNLGNNDNSDDNSNIMEMIFTGEPQFFDPSQLVSPPPPAQIEAQNPLEIAALSLINKAQNDPQKKSALEFAVMEGNIEVFDYLIKEYGMVVDYNQASLLHWAAYCGQDDMLCHLIDKHNIDRTKKDTLDYSALHHAAVAGQGSTVDLLIDRYGLNHAEETKFGKTAWDLALQRGHGELFVYKHHPAHKMSRVLAETLSCYSVPGLPIHHDLFLKILSFTNGYDAFKDDQKDMHNTYSKNLYNHYRNNPTDNLCTKKPLPPK